MSESSHLRHEPVLERVQAEQLELVVVLVEAGIRLGFVLDAKQLEQTQVEAIADALDGRFCVVDG